MGLTEERARRWEATLRLRQSYNNVLPSVSKPAADGSFWAADVEEFERGRWFVHHFAGGSEPSACGRYRANLEILEDVPRCVTLDRPAVMCAGCLRKTRRNR